MRTRYCLFLILTLLLLAGCKSGAKGPQGLILYEVLGEDGVPRPELVVVDPKGEEQHRIGLSDLIRQGFPAKAGYRALVTTFDDKQYLVDAEQGTAQILDLPGDVYPGVAQFRFGGGGERWMLLGNPQGSLAYVLDLETGQTHDLMAVDEELHFIFYGLFAPDEFRLIFGTGDSLWVAPAADLKGARRLGSGKSYAASFSSDGKQIVYIQRTEGGEAEVIVAQADGSGAEVVTAGKWFDRAAFVPGQKQLILATMDKLSLFSLEDRQARELMTYSGRSMRHWFAPDGKTLLFGINDGETLLWHLVDLKESTDQLLDELQGHQPFFWDTAHRWVVFVDEFTRGGARRFLSLDLKSGETRQLLSLEEDNRLWSLLDFSPDGQYSLLSALTEDQMQLWLLKADGGEPRLLAEGISVYGTFSPDGDWVAVSTVEEIGDERKARLTLVEIEGEETRSLGEGFRPLWVRP